MLGSGRAWLLPNLASKSDGTLNPRQEARGRSDAIDDRI